MRITLGCGLFEAGLAACITSFCLSPVAAFSQTDSPAAGDAFSESAVQRIQQQQQALLEAIERIQQHSEMAMDRYTDSALTQFNLLEQSFAAQHAQDLAAVEQLQRFTRNVVAVMVAGMVLSILVIAWVPLWATSRMTKQIVELGRLRGLLTAQDAVSPPMDQIESTLHRLEQRLLTLESPQAVTEAAAPDVFATDQPPSATRAMTTTRVALAVGEGSALVFLPHEAAPPRWPGLRRHFINLKKLWRRAAHSR